jgi:Holliday junction resolvase RusA-like endonuclease
MNFTIVGRPATKKNSSRIFLNKRTGARFIAPSQYATNWNYTAVKQIIEQGGDSMELECPLNLRALIYRDRAVGDIGNYLSAICDALQDSGAIVNDKWITQFDGSRLLIDRVVPRVEIYLEIL